METKAKCTQCTLYWCPRCLLNRYGEEVVGRPIMVYWKEEKTYYTGSITKYNQQTG